MNNSRDNTPSPSTNKMVNLFCHKCEKQQEQIESNMICPICKSDFIEIIDSEDEDLVPETEPINERSASSESLPLGREMQEFRESLERMYFNNGDNYNDVAFARGMQHLTVHDIFNMNHQMTAMIDQIEGIPPSTDDEIKKMPIITIEEEHLATNQECSICFDNFTLGESVKKLLCNHIFHVPCIVPWLKLHGSCPVCRKQFSSRVLSARHPFLDDTSFFGPINYHLTPRRAYDEQYRRQFAQRRPSVEFLLPNANLQNERRDYPFPPMSMFMHSTRPTSENRQVIIENAERPEEPIIDSINPDANSKSDDKEPPTNQ